MKYPEGMEEDIAVRPGMPFVEPGSKGKAFPKRGPLLLEREREENEVFFVGRQMKGYGRRRETNGRSCSSAIGSLTIVTGGLTTHQQNLAVRLGSLGGQTTSS
jgi:hypothetical protein